MLALPVEKSRAQRQQRLQARFRNRGGIFVPSEKNTLIDILLARSVTGESPSKRAVPRKQQGSSPIREKGQSKALDANGGQDAAARDVASLVDGKVKGETKASRNSSKKLKGKAAKHAHADASDDELPVAGPSRLDPPEKGKVSGSMHPGKGRSKKEVTFGPVEESHVAPKRRGRAPKVKPQPKDAQVDDDNGHQMDEHLRPAPKPRGRPPKSKQSSQPSKIDAQDGTTRTEEVSTKPKKAPKKRQRAGDSDQEDDDASSDYMPSSRKRVKADNAPAKSAATTTRKRKTVQITQPEPDDSDDSSAIVITVKKKAVKVDSAQNSVNLKQQPDSQASALIHDDEDKHPPGPRPKARQGAKSKMRLYVDDEDSDATQVGRYARKGADLPKTSQVSPDPQPDGEDKQHAASKSKSRVRSIKPSKTTAVPDSDGEEDLAVAPSKRSTKTRTQRSTSSGKGTAKTATKSSSKRSRDAADGEGPESDPEEPAPQPARKRTKAIVPPASDDETLVGTARSRATISPPEVGHLSEQNDIASVLAHSSKSSSRTLKENAITDKSKPTSRRTKQIQPKSSQAKGRKGPPQEVLNRIKAKPHPQTDSDTDPIDFLS